MKKKVIWYFSNGINGCTQEGSFIVDDDIDGDEIEEMAKEEVFNCVDWFYTVEESDEEVDTSGE